MAFSFCIIVDRSIPNFDQTLMTPSSPAVSRPVPSGLHRLEFTQPWCAFMIRSTRAFRFNIMNRPSLLLINNESLPLLLLFDEADDFAVVRELHNHCKSVGRKSSGNFATWFGARVFALHLYRYWSSLGIELELNLNDVCSALDLIETFRLPNRVDLFIF